MTVIFQVENTAELSLELDNDSVWAHLCKVHFSETSKGLISWKIHYKKLCKQVFAPKIKEKYFNVNMYTFK